MESSKDNKDSIIKLSEHRANGYIYASSQHYYTIDEKTGKKKYVHTHWGTLTADKEFLPNENYFFASEEVRKNLAFPSDWKFNKFNDVMRNLKLPEYKPLLFGKKVKKMVNIVK